MHEIAQWLKNPTDYFKGLELLTQQLASPFIISILSSGPDSFNKRKLYSELEKVLESHQVAADRREESKPIELKTKELTSGQLMDKRAELKAQLRFLATDPNAQAKRKDIAFEIIRIGKELDTIFSEKEFFDEHGYIPSGELEVDDDPLKLKARQATLRTYIVRYSKPDKSEDKLKAYQEELNIVNKKLEKYAV